LRSVQFPHRFTTTTIVVPYLAVPVLVGLRRREPLSWALAGALVAQVGLTAAVVVKDGFIDARLTPYAAADRLPPYRG